MSVLWKWMSRNFHSGASLHAAASSKRQRRRHQRLFLKGCSILNYFKKSPKEEAKLICSETLPSSAERPHLRLGLALAGLCSKQPWANYHMIRMHQVARVSALPPASAPPHYACRSVAQMWLLHREIPQRRRRLWLLQLHLIHDDSLRAHSSKEAQLIEVFLDINSVFHCMHCLILLHALRPLVMLHDIKPSF